MAAGGENRGPYSGRNRWPLTRKDRMSGCRARSSTIAAMVHVQPPGIRGASRAKARLRRAPRQRPTRMDDNGRPSASPTLACLYVCYLSLDDPLTHTQVVAYLSGLSRRGHRIHLLTYETQPLTRERRRHWRREMHERGISWHGLRYHKRPSLPATIFDVASGVALGSAIVLRHRLTAVHARAHVPAAVALGIGSLTGSRLIFDIRGLWAEEYVDAGRWQPGGVPFRITKRIERAAIRRAAAIVVLTERIKRRLFDPDDGTRVTVIPCCADLSALAAAAGQRAARRALLGVDGRIVLAYVGKFGGWYMAPEMVEFFAVAQDVAETDQTPAFHFLVLTQSDPEPIEREFRRLGIDPELYTIMRAEPEELGSLLAAADAGIAFIRPLPSKVASSPTKIGEYLGAGLPVVSGVGIGDVDALLGHGAGVLLPRFDRPAYVLAARAMIELIRDPATPGRCRGVAREHLDLEQVGLERYAQVYAAVARG